ncbi:MAG: slipin family protein [Sandaracinaceae bacterium]
MFHQIFHVQLHQRVVLFRDGLPTKTLGPGRHREYAGFRQLEKRTLDVRELVFDVAAEVRACLAPESFDEVRIEGDQRGVLFRDGVPVRFLGPGLHRYWTVDPAVTVHVYDVWQPLANLTNELLAVIPKREVVDTTVLEYQRGLLYISGKFERVLEPGRYALWNHAAAPVSVRLVDMRRKQLTVAGQELLTRDKVSLRLSLTLDFAPLDPATAPHTIADVEAALYTLVQLAVREHVSGVTLDELLEGREALTTYLMVRTEHEARSFGVAIHAVGVKDIVLPGDMKLLLNRVIEAQKQADANVILRKEEAAATRTLANAAKVMADNPVLLRLKELEALERIAGQVGEVKLSIGEDGLAQLAPIMKRLT